MATGISALPIEKIIFQPNKDDVIQVTNNEATDNGSDFVANINAKAPIDIEANGVFKYSL